MSGWLNAFAFGSCKVASKIFFQPPKRRSDVLITSPDRQIGTSLSSRGNSGNALRSSCRRGKWVSRCSTVVIPSRRSARIFGRGIQSSSSSGCEISIKSSAQTHALLPLASPNAFHLRIRPAGSERQCPTVASEARRQLRRKRSRVDDNCAAANATANVFRLRRAGQRPIQLRAQEKGAADSHYQTAVAFRASRQNRNSTPRN